MAWWNEEGQKFADHIYAHLLDSENGLLRDKDIMNIYDNYNRPLFRKAEGIAWDIIKSRHDIEYSRDEHGKIQLKWKKPNIARAWKLSNGDVAEIHGILVEYEDGMFYEVKRVREWFEARYIRTGRDFTPEQINEMGR